ncbi:MAG: hypothetical protein P4N60_20915 [Verrucomicrobiae bacterium]|nr:hypothetical protein [Verrucomicrobiae bacterium]
MNHNVPGLQVHIHKVDGTTTTFEQNAADEASAIIDGFHPAQVFYQEMIAITDKDSITSVPVSKITRIELVCDEFSHLVFPVGIVDAVELTEEEFLALIHDPVMRQQWEQLVTQDASLVTFMEMQMTDGTCFFLATEKPAEVQSQLWTSKGIALDGSGLCFRMRTGGVAVLNLAHLTRLTFYPKPTQTPANAWRAQRIHSPQPTAVNPLPPITPLHHRATT